MKKMWMIAAVACAALMVACGGGDKKAEKKADAAPAATTAAAVSPEAKAQEMVSKLKNAGSEAEAAAIAAPYESYYNSLSADDKAKFDAVLRNEGL